MSRIRRFYIKGEFGVSSDGEVGAVDKDDRYGAFAISPCGSVMDFLEKYGEETCIEEEPQKCPRCFSEARTSGTRGFVWTYCQDCHVSGPIVDTKQEAIAAWNKIRVVK